MKTKNTGKSQNKDTKNNDAFDPPFLWSDKLNFNRIES